MVPDVPEDSDRMSVQAESKHASRKKTVTPIKVVQPRNADNHVSLVGTSKGKGRADIPARAQDVDDSDVDVAVTASEGSETDDVRYMLP